MARQNHGLQASQITDKNCGSNVLLQTSFLTSDNMASTTKNMKHYQFNRDSASVRSLRRQFSPTESNDRNQPKTIEIMEQIYTYGDGKTRSNNHSQMKHALPSD